MLTKNYLFRGDWRLEGGSPSGAQNKLARGGVSPLVKNGNFWITQVF